MLLVRVVGGFSTWLFGFFELFVRRDAWWLEAQFFVEAQFFWAVACMLCYTVQQLLLHQLIGCTVECSRSISFCERFMQYRCHRRGMLCVVWSVDTLLHQELYQWGHVAREPPAIKADGRLLRRGDHFWIIWCFQILFWGRLFFALGCLAIALLLSTRCEMWWTYCLPRWLLLRFLDIYRESYDGCDSSLSSYL